MGRRRFREKTIEAKRTHFIFFFEELCYVGLDLRFLAIGGLRFRELIQE